MAATALTVFGAQAHEIDTAQLLIHYTFTHVRDTINPDKPYSENMILYVGKSASAFRSFDWQVQGALFRKHLSTRTAENTDGSTKLNHLESGHLWTASGTEYYQYPNQTKLFTKEQLTNDYLVEEALPTIDWKICPDTASFGGLHCQKATAHFKGRDYIAWFCPDIPIHVGPWKLNGLPGVIVEAYDAKKEVVFKFVRAEKPPSSQGIVEKQPDEREKVFTNVRMDDLSDPNIIILPIRAIKATPKEFNKLKEAIRKNPHALDGSMMAAQGSNLQGGSPPRGADAKVGPVVVINNPIELPDKK